jgi:hypothetical protein
MTNKLELIRNGNIYSLVDGTYSHYLGDNGWGAAPTHRLTARGPQQHGESDYGFRLDPRVGSVVLGIPGSSLEDLFSRRGGLIALFGPANSLALRWTIGSLVKQIDVKRVGGLSLASANKSGFYQRAAVDLRAADPSFYDPDSQLQEFGLGSGANEFEVPMPVPHHVGASTLDETVGINYPGSWHSFPFIRITGPITNPVITNESTGEVLDFTGTTIVVGDYYDIDCAYDAKTVIDDSGVNKIADLTDDSDLATFHISCDCEAVPGGANSISVTGSATTTATKVTMTYFNRYEGL